MATHTARFLAGAADPAQFPQLDWPEIAFAGRSNVGKSSLMNRLVGHRSLARVSKTPGCTQQINFFLVDERLTLVDLPGYGFAHVPAAIRWRWKRLVETYLSRRRNLRAVVLIIDLRRGIENDEEQLCTYLATLRIPIILVATKSDKLAYGERQRCAQALTEAQVSGVAARFLCSGRTGEGLPQLWRQIEVYGREVGCSRWKARARDKI